MFYLSRLTQKILFLSLFSILFIDIRPSLSYATTMQDHSLYSREFHKLISQDRLNQYCATHRKLYSPGECQRLTDTVVLSSELSTELQGELIKYITVRPAQLTLLIDRTKVDLAHFRFLKDRGLLLSQLDLVGKGKLSLADCEVLKGFSISELGLLSMRQFDQTTLDHLAKNIKVRRLKLGLTKLPIQGLDLLKQIHVLEELHLNNISTLSLKDAQQLSRLEVNRLFLSGLKTLSVESAKELLNFQGNQIDLHGLKKVDQKVLELLAKGYDRPWPQPSLQIHLNGLRNLSLPTYAHLCANLFFGQWTETISTLTVQEAQLLIETASKENCGLTETLTLPKLKTMSLDVLKVLVQHPRDLALGGLEKLSSKMIKLIVMGKILSIQFAGLKSIKTEDLKQLLSEYNGSISFGGLKKLEIEQAQAIAQAHEFNDKLDLSGLKTLAPKIAHELSKSTSSFTLSLNGLEELSEESAKELSRFKGILSLKGLKSASYEVIKALTLDRFEGERSTYLLKLNFRQLHLDQKALLLLAHYYYDVHEQVRQELATANPLTPLLAQFMLDHYDIKYPSLSQLKSIEPEAAQILAKHGKEYVLDLSGLDSFSIEIAQALQSFSGTLVLGMTSLDEKIAAALAKSNIHTLRFTKLKNFSLELAQIFSHSSLQNLTLDSISSVFTPKHAQALSKLGGHISLGFKQPNEESVAGLTLLDVASISLSGLEEISPQLSQLLAQSKSDYLGLTELKTLSVESAKALSKFEGYFLHLPKTVYAKSTEVSAALSECLCRIK